MLDRQILAPWILANIATRFMESLYFLNITGNTNDLDKNLKSFAQLPGEKSTGPGELNFLIMSPLNSLNLVLIRGAKFDGHRRTWTGRTCEQEDFEQEKQQTLNKRIFINA